MAMHGPLRLFIKSPGMDERVYDMDAGEVTIGRDAAVEIPVEDRTLSRRHCRVYVGADGWRVTDLGSRNGTFLNGNPILDDRLEEGDRIELGETKITAYLPKGEMTTAAQEADLEAILQRAMKSPKARSASVVGRRREIRALTHLMELNEKINALRDEDQLLEGVLDAAIELTDAGRGFLLLKEEDHFIVRRARLPHHRDLTDPDGSFSVSVAAEVIREGKSVLSEDMQMDDRFEGTASVANLKLRSLVCVPVHARDSVLGAIYLDNAFEKGTFDGWDVRMLESFASLASIAIRNARERREIAMRRREAVRQSRRIERLNERLKKALRIRTNALRRAREDLAKQADELGLKYSYGQIVGRSPAMKRVLRLVDRVTDLMIPVLIVGESGTGKELIARAIHFNGPRRRARIVGENCAAVPETLMESEFFGYERGAFTGAHRDHAGLFEQAHEGTLFLDEVGEMSLDMQKKFLRVLEEGEVRRIGAKAPVSADFRLVSATNRDLGEMLRAAHFREDLYYRIAGVVIELPPLRERKDDVPALVAHFMEESAAQNGGLRLDPAAMDLLVAYEWPGNVRELRNEVLRLRALQTGGVIHAEHLSSRILAYRPPDPEEPVEQGLKAMVEDLERRVIRAALLRHGWNKSRTAAELGLSRLGLRKKLERYGLDSEQPPKAGI
ncbi:MAG: sigma 54-interacting transcriptional regulator [Planctomycetota bacterium]|nr:sigma 54-interacting transcriptional regulator [Planctomycetota bacterium]